MHSISQSHNETVSETKSTTTTMAPKRSPSPAGSSEKRDLSACFEPGDFDVICGKGKGCFNHQGNKNFRRIVGIYLPGYAEATSKLEKSAIVSAIIQSVRTQSPDGGFVKRDLSTGLWSEVGDHLAREKVGQTIRDALHLQYRSSTKAKKKRRQAEQAKASANMTQISSTHFEISSKIDDLKSKVTDSLSDQQLANMFTQANLEILNELNRLQQLQTPGEMAIPQPSLIEATFG